MEVLIIMIILAIAAAYLFRRFRRNLSGQASCGCGCGDGCGQSCNAACEDRQGGRDAHPGPFPMAPGKSRKSGRDA